MKQVRFDVKPRCQREWGWMLAMWLFLSGTAATLFLYYAAFGLPLGFAQLSLGLMLMGGVVLLLEQGNPARAWRAAARVKTSWLSRGVLFVSCFIASSVLYLVPIEMMDRDVLASIVSVCALSVVLYPGFFLAKNRSIPFWNTPLLPAVLVVNAALAAAAAVLAAGHYLMSSGRLPVFGTLAAVLTVASGGMVAIYLWAMYRAGGAAQESVRLLMRSPLAGVFWGGAIGLGMCLPLCLLLLVPGAGVWAGACVLVGSLLLRYSLLKAGVYVPYAIVQAGIDFRRINRTGDELEREYRDVMRGCAEARG
jgi:formate-dependent nitrite reductase membrane component NrfD